MWLTRVLNIVRTQEPIIKKHTNEYTGFQVANDMKNDKSWGRRKVKMMTAHLYGRPRNCHRLAHSKMVVNLNRSMKGRAEARKDFKELCDLRIEAASKEIHYDPIDMRETLARLHIGLNRKVLTNLAIWEPRTFRSIAALCAYKENMPVEDGGLNKDKAGPGTEVISRGHL